MDAKQRTMDQGKEVFGFNYGTGTKYHGEVTSLLGHQSAEVQYFRLNF